MAIFTPAFRLRLKRFRILHAPLSWINRTALPAVRRLLIGLGRRILPAHRSFGPARGWYSDLAALTADPGAGRCLLRDQSHPRLPDPSIILLCQRNQHLQQPWPVFWRLCPQARLIGHSLVHLNHRQELSVEAAYGAPWNLDDPAWLCCPMRAPLELSGSWTSVVSRWLPNHGKSPYAHWLLDALPRLALLEEFPSDTRIIVPRDMYPSQRESLALLGLESRIRPTPETHLRVENFYFSSPPSMIVSYSPYSVECTRRLFLAKVPRDSGTPRRFFVRRTSYGRNMINEREVLEFFEKLGWTIIDAATLGFAQQIQWFAAAEAICAIHGSGTANMVWCSPGCKFIELFAADYLAGDQEWIAQCVHVDYHFMTFPCDYKLDAIIDLRVLRQKLEKLSLL